MTFLSVYAFSRPIALQSIEGLQTTNIEKVRISVLKKCQAI